MVYFSKGYWLLLALYKLVAVSGVVCVVILGGGVVAAYCFCWLAANVAIAAAVSNPFAAAVPHSCISFSDRTACCHTWLLLLLPLLSVRASVPLLLLMLLCSVAVSDSLAASVQCFCRPCLL